MSPTAPTPLEAERVWIGEGVVRHHRLRPRAHGFEHRTWFALLPMHALPQAAAASGLALNRRGAIAFFDSDHGDGRGPIDGGALTWLRALLAAHGVHDADGPVWLHTYLRVLGYAFKPVSFWYCHRADGTLRAIVAEVNNTFGERHCYVLDRPAWGATLHAPKAFHVSPFCRVEGGYAFRFLHAHADGQPRTVVRIDYADQAGALLRTSVSGALRPAGPGDWPRLLWRHRWHSAAVIARIHWHALRLWLKGVPVHAKPPAPALWVTRQSPLNPTGAVR
ncbi:hypothetical protein Tsedi_00722 [Tepidimonas sediminis]|uniref:DUF1365 domain-containing protein n=1 Tax=Tepidimonas sediminis TaxID=2588941 RepID=A0A554WS94_9BURK|nr:DUF1365 domain-containing protein [Tepidimonas sediminis]TSE26424.1 hypothetical protein Tsedi_00722 [Tepidimonas sediminis]